MEREGEVGEVAEGGEGIGVEEGEERRGLRRAHVRGEECVIAILGCSAGVAEDR